MKTRWIFTTTGVPDVFGHPKMKARLDRYSNRENWVVHDFLRSLSTLLCVDLGSYDDLADQMLAHTRKGVAGTYNSATRLNQRRKARKVWSAAIMGTGPRKLKQCGI